MEEETMIIVPYIHYKAPPRCIDTKSMLQYVHEELDQWTKTLNSKLSIYDGIHMKNLKKESDGLHIIYKIIRNRIKPEEEKGE